jgi:hypothetical protein
MVGAGKPPLTAGPTPTPACGQTGQCEDGAPAPYASDPRGPHGGYHAAFGDSFVFVQSRDAFSASLPHDANVTAVNDASARGWSAASIRANLNRGSQPSAP